MPAVFVNGTIPAVDHEAITVSTAAIGLTAGKLLVVNSPAQQTGVEFPFYETRRPDEILVTIETSPIRFRVDGQASPTSTTGHLMQPGDTFTVAGLSNLQNLKMIRDTTASADATVRVTYYRRN